MASTEGSSGRLSMIFAFVALAILIGVGFAFFANNSQSAIPTTIPKTNTAIPTSTPLPTPTPGPTVQQIFQRESMLLAASTRIPKIDVESSKSGWLDLCQNDVQYRAYFDIKAGVNLNLFRYEITKNGYPQEANVKIYLPEPTIVSNELDLKNSGIITKDGASVPLCNDNTAELVTKLQQKLQEQALQDAKDGGILKNAEYNSAEEILKILQNVGYRNVTIFDHNGTQIRKIGQ
ncbi:DUF4230 domain-containing protein [Herpetosiphon llansteffanensis]|uniref:DUF4230 domain-containing protein n=1 Tax=Herpetosiphon llansteffanensis TaxID=2094568 RepID=UPI000D7CECAA|nr:DUF4230 domain-containing protein [Herpetosiphon llansteffanensis]